MQESIDKVADNPLRSGDPASILFLLLVEPNSRLVAMGMKDDRVFQDRPIDRLPSTTGESDSSVPASENDVFTNTVLITGKQQAATGSFRPPPFSLVRLGKDDEVQHTISGGRETGVKGGA